jgi:hypothetical protein
MMFIMKLKERSEKAGAFMMAGDFDSMSIDELWAFHEDLAKALAARLTSEKAALEVRLDQLQ